MGKNKDSMLRWSDDLSKLRGAKLIGWRTLQEFFAFDNAGVKAIRNQIMALADAYPHTAKSPAATDAEAVIDRQRWILQDLKRDSRWASRLCGALAPDSDKPAERRDLRAQRVARLNEMLVQRTLLEDRGHSQDLKASKDDVASKNDVAWKNNVAPTAPSYPSTTQQPASPLSVDRSSHLVYVRLVPAAESSPDFLGMFPFLLFTGAQDGPFIDQVSVIKLDQLLNYCVQYLGLCGSPGLSWKADKAQPPMPIKTDAQLLRAIVTQEAACDQHAAECTIYVDQDV